MSLFNPPDDEEMTLERMRYASEQRIDRYMLGCLASAHRATYEAAFKDETIARLEATILGLSKDETEVIAWEKVPATWWDHVKERFLEPWGWTVRRREIATRVERRTTRLCPHLEDPVPVADRRANLHLRWLKGEDSPPTEDQTDAIAYRHFRRKFAIRQGIDPDDRIGANEAFMGFLDRV